MGELDSFWPAAADSEALCEQSSIRNCGMEEVGMVVMYVILADPTHICLQAAKTAPSSKWNINMSFQTHLRNA